MIYRANEAWSLFGNYAHGFRAPNANQVNGYYENMAKTGGDCSQPRAQAGDQQHAGIRGAQHLERLTLDVAAFAGRYDDLIVDNVLIAGTGVSGNPKLFQTVNTDRARIQGFEFKGGYGSGPGRRWPAEHAVRLWARQGFQPHDGQAAQFRGIPAKAVLGLNYDTAAWTLRLDLRHIAAKKAEDIDSGGLVKPPNTQITVPAATVVDLYSQWRVRKNLRLNVGITNLTDAPYWMWSDVQGLAASTTVADAYTQPGRNLSVSMVYDFLNPPHGLRQSGP